jgi:hypothetical protein
MLPAVELEEELHEARRPLDALGEVLRQACNALTRHQRTGA